MPAAEPLGVRIARKLRADGDCILWTGAKRPAGYGVVGGSQRGRNYYDSPHRVVYRLTKGAIPDGHQVDHLCRVRACVQPDHLEAVAQGVNIRRENALRWHGIATPCPTAHLTLGDLVALLTQPEEA